MPSSHGLFYTIEPERSGTFLAGLEAYRLRYLRQLSGWGRGPHASRYAGTGMEFREFRDYAQGDDLRHLDWKTTARFARPYVRTFQHEESRFVEFLIDASRSMVIHDEDRKFDYARDIALSLGYLALCSEDHAIFTVVAGGPVQQRYRCTNRGRLARVRNFMDRAITGGRMDLPQAAAKTAREHATRHGTVVIISDLLFPDEKFRTAVQILAGKGLQTAVIQVVGVSERDLPRVDEDVIELRDCETGRVKRISLDQHSRELYRHAMRAHQSRVQSFAYSMRSWFAVFEPPSDYGGRHLERFILRSLPGMGLVHSKT